MSEPKLISPMLDNFAIGDPISSHDGVVCCPAMEKDKETKYIVKIISIPASQSQLDALLLSGAYQSPEAALSYFTELANSVVTEIETLSKLSQSEGFLPYEKYQLVPKEDGTGFDIYLLSKYRRTLHRHLRKQPMTYLDAVNLGLDMCACLSVCRRSGYLYVDLKPENIFISEDNEFRIGDLGFIPLDSLKYASLPDKYRSAYTAPEAADALNTLNDKLDIYAAGLILYQVYNNGALPFEGDSAPDTVFPAPMNADYEMSEIILKACAPNPEDRWSSPIEMGQAIVGYMQRNGANDTPILPPATEVTESDVTAEPEQDTADGDSQDTSATAEDDTAATDGDDTASEEPVQPESQQEAQEVTAPEEEPTAPTYAEDSMGNLSFLDPQDGEEPLSEEEVAEIMYSEVSEDVSEMLDKIDDLAAHDVPAPVVAPEPIDVPVPEPVTEEPEEQPEGEDSPEGEPESSEEAPEQDAEDEEDEEAQSIDTRGHKKSHILRNTLLSILILALIGAGIFFYRSYFLQHIDSMELAGEGNTLTVYVSSEIDEAMLTVVCADAYGNQIPAPVSGGKASFADLVPNTAYTVSVTMKGFHRLTGSTTAAYSTPLQTSIVQFLAVTGSESGSAIVSFTVDGPDSEQWTLTYSVEGEQEQTVTFSGHMTTLTGLEVGKEYVLKLAPEKKLYVVGTDSINFTASDLIYAQNLKITSCIDGKLTAQWSAPQDITVNSWTVRCYDGDSYNETITTEETSATFEGVDSTKELTVEVSAAGMSVSQKVTAAPNAITAGDFAADTSDPRQIKLSWSLSQAAPEEGLQVVYTVDGYTVSTPINAKDNTAVISPAIAGSHYAITLQQTDGSALLGSPFTVDTPAAAQFSRTYSGYTITAEKMTFRMCKTPNKSGWTYKNLAESDYTSDFSSGEKASFLVKAGAKYGISNDPIVTSIVIRDEAGRILSIQSQERTWTSMWKKNYCSIDIPSIPTAAGKYAISIFFDGQLAHQQDFTVQ